MDDNERDFDDSYCDSWNQLSHWERDCLHQAEAEPDLEKNLHDSQKVAIDKLWNTFQITATSVAQMYKDKPVCRCPSVSNSEKTWLQFQDAANRVTLLYKEGVDSFQVGVEWGTRQGYQRKTRDVLAWVKKKKKYIKREDLISFLCGRTSPRRRSLDSRNVLNSPNTELDDLYDGRKRHHNSDVIMDSPGHKRQRFC